MTTVKRISDLTDYTAVLPYASEMFGIYQPLLGWKSGRIEDRFRRGYEADKAQLVDKLMRRFAPIVDIKYEDSNRVEIAIQPGVLSGGKIRSFGSVVLDKISSNLPPLDDLTREIWETQLTTSKLNAILKKDVVEFYTGAYSEARKTDAARGDSLLRLRAEQPARVLDRQRAQLGAFEHQLQYESSVAGALLQLVKAKSYVALREIFYAMKDAVDEAQRLIEKLNSADGVDAFLNIETLDPGDREQIRGVALSPISVVHLFRQYFFELDTFLGPPVSHVWLSPGSSVELIETHTRRTVVERTLETNLEMVMRTETSITQRDEISEAVKDDNQRDVKFGASVKASYGSIEATSNFDYANSQKSAREQTHKQMREQTDKLSSEIRRSFKSTFKSVAEFTDVSSTRHTMANTSDDLINYELRRKMQQVGVQVQDIGTFLCWQTYVDDPGRELGLAKLIHIAKPAELDAIPHPEEIPLLQPFQEEKLVTIPFISIDDTGADNEGEVYVDGVEAEDSEWGGNEERIQADFAQHFVCPKANYVLTDVEFDAQGKPASLRRDGNLPSDGSFILHLASADFQGQNSLQVKLILHWSPDSTANNDIVQKNKENLSSFKEAEKAAYEKAYVETVRERVTMASQIRTRNGEELREEERIVVYRKLVQDMLLKGIDLPDDRTRHVTAELLNAIFDVDKMLYFVAPEWWRPRLRGRQQLQETSKPPRPPKWDSGAIEGFAGTSLLRRGLLERSYAAGINSGPGVMSASTVGWGGVNDAERDNYFITDESEPARFGSSLGWLLQLDGDNMRNAFLNAPWVKAVIPIRPGKEKAAINWLKGVEGMNGITDDVIYRTDNPNEVDVDGDPLDGQKMIDVLMDLAEKVRRKYNAGIETGKYPKQDEVSNPALIDPDNVVTATPIDRVYEHGFFPLDGGFRANVGKDYEIFDQWIEILPTDQIVPVEVTYDPKTGRQT
jgi:hypothetical protein